MIGVQGTGIGIGYCLLNYLSFLFKKKSFSQYWKMTRKWKIMKKAAGLGEHNQTLHTSI